MAKWTLRRIYLDRAGYAPNGSYYGHGLPLYEACDDDMQITEGFATLRAVSRDKAKQHIRDQFDNSATFYS